MQFIETAVSASFAREVGQADESVNLARAGLLFAASEYSNLDCEWYLGQLDLIASDIAKCLPSEASVSDRLIELNTHLFAVLGFSGNKDDYYDPRNSYLNEVIERRIGLPITLSIVYLELARRLDIEARGVSFPGHFLVSILTETDELIVDAFDSGASLTRATFLRRLIERGQAGTSRDVLERSLKPASNTEILLRQLRNLKAIYANKGLVEKSLNTINHMLSIDPDLMPEILERGALYDTLGYARGAADDYARGLELLPAGANHEEVAERLRQAKAKASQLH